MQTKLRKLLSALLTLLMMAGVIAAAPITASAATHKVKDQAELVAAMNSAASGDTIELTRSIDCTVPMTVDKTLYITGALVDFRGGLTIDGGELLKHAGADTINVLLDGTDTAALIVRNGKAEIDNVYASGTDMWAISASNSTVRIYGNVECDCGGNCVGVFAESGSTVTIDGYMLLEDGATYIKVNNASKSKAQFEAATTKAEYRTYKNGTSTVWVFCGEHVWGEYKKNAAKHWLECNCGAKREEEPHAPGEWIIDKAATATTAGSRHKECDVCGYITVTETIPATGGNTLPGTNREASFLNWILYIVFFGWLWMRF